MVNVDARMFKKHIGKGIDWEMEDDEGIVDVFHFKPLDSEFIPEYMDFIRAFVPLMKKASSDKEEIEESDVLEYLDKDTTKNLIELIKNMVTTSYPDLDAKDVSGFTSSNFINLIYALIEANRFSSGQKQKTIDKIKEKQKKVNNVRAEVSDAPS